MGKSKSALKSVATTSMHSSDLVPPKKKKKSGKSVTNDLSNTVHNSSNPKKKKRKRNLELPSFQETFKDEVSDELTEEEVEQEIEAISSKKLKIEEVKDDVTEDMELDDESLHKIPKLVFAELFNRIQEQIPSNDSILPKTRINKIDWLKVAFDGYTADKCKLIWKAVQKRQRNYRTLRELVEDAKVWMEKPWQSFHKMKATKQHPDFPKRPLSSFMLYFMDVREIFLNAHPELKSTELSKLVGQKFKELKDSQKKKYIAKALAERENFEKAVKEFYRRHPELQKDEDSSKAYLGPKKPPTPFALFFEHQMKKESSIPDKNEYRSAMREKWNRLPDKKKIQWIQWASEMYDHYKEEFTAFKNENPDTSAKLVKCIISKDELKLKNRFDGVPDKPPTSAYSLFTRTLLNSGELDEISAKDKIKTVGAQWKVLSPSQKAKYQAKYLELNKQYKEEYDAYLQGLSEEERLKILNATPNAKKRKVAQAPSPKKAAKETLSDLTPAMWNEMPDKDREMYMNAVNKLKIYFESKHKSDVTTKEEPSDSSDDDEDSSDDE